MQLLLADSPASTADYRRQARRIRASFDRDPFLRQQALSQLAQRRNVQTQVQAIHREVIARRANQVAERTMVNPVINPAISSHATSSVEQGFSDHAASRLQSFGYTFSDRVRLLDSAEKLGISRFRANMLLAMQEHQAPARQFAAPEVPSRSFAPSLVVILGIEFLVVAALLALYAL